MEKVLKTFTFSSLAHVPRDFEQDDLINLTLYLNCTLTVRATPNATKNTRGDAVMAVLLLSSV